MKEIRKLLNILAKYLALSEVCRLKHYTDKEIRERLLEIQDKYYITIGREMEDEAMEYFE